MICGQCGAANAEQARFCQACGTPMGPAPTTVPVGANPPPPAGFVPPPAGTVGTSPPPAGFGPAPVSAVGFNPPPGGINFRRLGIGDFIAGGATVLLLISLFLPWYTASSSGIDGEGAFSVSVSALGNGAGGWRFLILLLCLLTVGYLFARTVWPNPKLFLPHWQVLGLATALNFVLTLVAFLVKPGGSGGLVGEITGFSISWGFGAFVGLLFAIAAVVGAFVRANEPEVIATGSTGLPGLAPVAQYQPVVQANVPVQQVAVSPARYCAGCRAQLAPGDQFCAACGTPA